jgi:hypothetical protein
MLQTHGLNQDNGARNPARKTVHQNHAPCCHVLMLRYLSSQVPNNVTKMTAHGVAAISHYRCRYRRIEAQEI